MNRIKSFLLLFLVSITFLGYSQDRLIGIQYGLEFSYSFFYDNELLTKIDVHGIDFQATLLVEYNEDKISKISSSSNHLDSAYNFELIFNYLNSGILDQIFVNEENGTDYITIETDFQNIVAVNHFTPHNINSSEPYYATEFFYDENLLVYYKTGYLIDIDFHESNVIVDSYVNNKLNIREYGINSGNSRTTYSFKLNNEGDITNRIRLYEDGPIDSPTDTIQFDIESSVDAKTVVYPDYIFKLLNGYIGCGYSDLLHYVRRGFVDKKVNRIYYPYNNQSLITYDYETLVVNNMEEILAKNESILYPNPATELLNIKQVSDIDCIEVYNSVGQKEISDCSINDGVDISHLPMGNYRTKILYKNGRIVENSFIKL